MSRITISKEQYHGKQSEGDVTGSVLGSSGEISLAGVKKRLYDFLVSNNFFIDKELADIIDLKLASKRKVFMLKGPAGVGKTSLAFLIAKYLGAKMVFFQATYGTGEDELLYKYIPSEKTKSGIAITYGPLPLALEASKNGKVVLVIDEFDKTRPQTDALLLDFLQNNRLSLYIDDEKRTITGNPDNLVVILTSNDAREFSEPLMRRVTVIELEPPPPEFVKSMLEKRFDEKTANMLTNIYIATLKAQLRKPATIQELIEMGEILEKKPDINLETLLKSLIIKYPDDWDLFKSYISRYETDEEEEEENAEENEETELVIPDYIETKEIELSYAEPINVRNEMLVYAIIPDSDYDAYTKIVKEVIEKNGIEKLPENPSKISKFMLVEEDGKTYIIATEPLTVDELIKIDLPGLYYAAGKDITVKIKNIEKLLREATKIYSVTQNDISFELEQNGSIALVKIKPKKIEDDYITLDYEIYVDGKPSWFKYSLDELIERGGDYW